MPRRTVAISRVAAFAAALLTAAMIRPLVAQDEYEFEVYSSETVLPHFFMIELHGNDVINGATIQPNAPSTIFDRYAPPASPSLLFDPTCRGPGGPALSRTSGAAPMLMSMIADTVACVPPKATSTTHTTRQALEIAVGITDWWEVGGYLLGNRPPGGALDLAGASLRTTLRIPHEWRWPIGVAMVVEGEETRARFSPNTWAFEIRPVIDKAMGRWYVSFNPTLDRTLRGPGTALGVQFSPSATATFDVTRKITTGLEYFGAWGELTSLANPATRLQQLFGIIDLRLSPVWELNGGVGVGLTTPSDPVTVKVLIGRRFAY